MRGPGVAARGWPATGSAAVAANGATNNTSVSASDAAGNQASVGSNSVTTTVNVGGGTVLCEEIVDRDQCRNQPACQRKRGGCVTR